MADTVAEWLVIAAYIGLPAAWLYFALFTEGFGGYDP